MTTQFCPVCKTATIHRKLPKTGFFTQVAASLISFAVIGEGSGVREPEYECLNCGREK